MHSQVKQRDTEGQGVVLLGDNTHKLNHWIQWLSKLSTAAMEHWLRKIKMMGLIEFKNSLNDKKKRDFKY